jgi:two-component system, NtrC family, sensor kinase
MFFRGIKNRVFLHYWILLFLAMLLIDVPLFVIFLNRSIQQCAEATQRQLNDLCSLYSLSAVDQDPNGPQKIERSISPNARFLFIAQRFRASGDPSALEKQVLETLASGIPRSRQRGSAMGLLFPRMETLTISRPVIHGTTIIAAGGIETSFSPIYKDFRRLHTITLVFIVINSFFFGLFGNRRLGRIYFSPLSRLAKRAESYHDEETLFFSVRKEDNEFAILSSSLNKMVDRIRENKRELTETIRSLKTANQDLKKAQQDVIRAEKLATVGRLTSGIAHEIGNPIGIVLGYLDLLKQSDLGDDERTDFIRRSEDEITRINGIIRQLLDMSRSSSGELKQVPIHPLLDELVAVFNYQPYGGDIVFEKQFEATSDLVFADSDQLRQVFLNIVLNAVDAVTASGTNAPKITLRTRTMTGNDKTAGAPMTIQVGICDNGPGIAPEHFDHLFDPFFTTKAPGKGTGLGLSVSYMILEKFNGEIFAHCPESGGTEFLIILPLYGGSANNPEQDRPHDT